MAAAPHYADYDPDACRRSDVTVAVRAADTGGFRDADAAAHLAADVYGGAPDAWRDRLTRSLHRPGSLLAIAEVGGEVAGYGKAAHCSPVDDADPAPAGRYLTGLIVAPRWRRCGVGEALTRWRLERIHADGEPTYFFTNVRNAASIALHAQLGFVEVGRASSYLGEPFAGGSGVLMRCDLHPLDEH